MLHGDLPIDKRVTSELSPNHC